MNDSVEFNLIFVFLRDVKRKRVTLSPHIPLLDVCRSINLEGIEPWNLFQLQRSRIEVFEYE